MRARCSLPLLVYGLSACAEAPPIDAPNLILIVVDTLRSDMVNDAADRIDTPEIDRLAADGVLFPWAFGHAPMTLPAHTALFSSRSAEAT